MTQVMMQVMMQVMQVMTCTLVGMHVHAKR